MTALHDLTAIELLSAYRGKKLSPSEVFADIEQHIARWEPHLKALYAYDPESARAEAAASTARWAKRAPTGPLDGVPATVKEKIASKGVLPERSPEERFFASSERICDARLGTRSPSRTITSPLVRRIMKGLNSLSAPSRRIMISSLLLLVWMKRGPRTAWRNLSTIRRSTGLRPRRATASLQLLLCRVRAEG